MSDIVKALRALGKYRCDCQQPGRGCPESPAWEAADEIEQLRAKLTKVRAWAEGLNRPGAQDMDATVALIETVDAAERLVELEGITVAEGISETLWRAIVDLRDALAPFTEDNE